MIQVRAYSEGDSLLPTPTKSESEKRELGQFFTSQTLANFIATFFTRPLSEWRVIDAGAGAGALTLALLRHALNQKPLPISFHVTAYEIDPEAINMLRASLDECQALCAKHGVAFTAELRTEDFIAHTAASLDQGFLHRP